MWLFAIFLGFFSLALSAVSSGSETGFYRVPRIRLKLDAISGDYIARGLLWLANRPSFFVATILASNNLANYLISFSAVMFVQAFFSSQGAYLEIVLTLLLAPVLFVYAEMFPKYLFLHAPNRLLRYCAPLIFVEVVLFLPITVFLWLTNRFFSLLLGRSHEVIRLSLARSELAKTLEEGEEAGVLRKIQRRLAEVVFSFANQQIRNFTVPLNNYPFITSSTRPKVALSLAHALKLNEMPVYEEPYAGGLLAMRQKLVPIGYVRTIDLELLASGVDLSQLYNGVDNSNNKPDNKVTETKNSREKNLPIRDFVEISGNYSVLTTMNLFETTDESLGIVLDANKNCIGAVTADRLLMALRN
ncbi:MAG: CNNM domain-containing protein [Thermoguttaceae bacterium]